MYQDFFITSVTTNMTNKSITITASRDIDTNIDNVIIDLYERNSKTPLHFFSEVLENKLFINLEDWPIPNTNYILTVKNLTSIIGETLEANIKKVITFKSAITSKVNIISPSNHQILNPIKIKLKETVANNELINSYYIEISSNNSFLKPEIAAIYTSNEFEINLKQYGQYYLRARAQYPTDEEKIEYGEFSEIVTFINKYIEAPNGDIYDKEEEDNNDGSNNEDNDDGNDDDGPIFDLEDFKIIDYPIIGQTPESFVFKFNKPIKEESLKDILIIEKDIS